MNIFSYIDKYSSKNFQEEPFNEVDNIIFSTLSYIDLNNYVSHNKSNKKTIEQVGNNYFQDHPNKEKTILATKNALKVLKYIKNTLRYKNLLLYNYCYIGDKEQQFSAITIEINNHLIYVSFEGTDGLISGWKEDFMMSYKFPVLSQRRAIDYINKNFLFTNKKIILGGHSKGGNLALVSGMYANFFIKRKIINIYNNDGPGLINKQFNSKKYLSIKNKLIHIIPNYSVFGLIFNHDNSYIVIKSTKKNIFAHDFATWVVEKNTFQRSTLSTLSIAIEKGCAKWLNKYDYQKREKFIKNLFQTFEELNITNLMDFNNNKKLIIDLIMKSQNIDNEIKLMLKDFIQTIFNYFKEIKLEELQILIGNKK